MSESSLCPFCSRPITGERIRLWDGRSYCHPCVEKVCPDLLELVATGRELEDSVAPEDVRAWTFLSYIGKPILIGIGLVFGIPLAVAIWSGDAATIQGIAMLMLGVGGFFLFYLTAMALVHASKHRARLPRTITVDSGVLRICTPDGTKSVELKDCKWYYGKTSVDELCWYSGLRRGVVIQTPESNIGCGHSPELVGCWRGFLSLARVPKNPPLGCLRGFVITIAGTSAGLAAGIAIGVLVWMLTRHPLAVFTIAFLGTIDGGAAACAYASATSEGWKAAKARLSPLVIALVFAAVGLKFGGIFGIPGLILFAIINGAIGAVVGWMCQVRIRASQSEDEANWQFDRSPGT